VLLISCLVLPPVLFLLHIYCTTTAGKCSFRPLASELPNLPHRSHVQHAREVPAPEFAHHRPRDEPALLRLRILAYRCTDQPDFDLLTARSRTPPVRLISDIGLAINHVPLEITPRPSPRRLVFSSEPALHLTNRRCHRHYSPLCRAPRRYFGLPSPGHGAAVQVVNLISV
jgi:hypothetical protein